VSAARSDSAHPDTVPSDSAFASVSGARGRGRVLFLTYDGLEDHIAQSQILPYVEGLAGRGWQFTVISHEKGATPSSPLVARLAAADIRWVRRRYHRGNPAKTVPLHVAADLQAAAHQVLRSGRFDIVHARSYLPGLSAIPFARTSGAKFLFDMRGFWIDEKIDSGLWRRGRMYDAGKRIERALFRNADGVVSLTHVGRTELLAWPEIARRRTPITVIPTCVDVDSFTPPSGRRGSDAPLIGWVGSLGERYPIDAAARVVARLRQRAPGTRWLVLTNSDSSLVGAAATRAGIPEGALEVRSVPYAEIPAQLARVDATISFVKRSFATLATCPTKFGESLAMGAPVVVNHGIGDCADIVSSERVGTVTDLSAASLDRAADELVQLLAGGGVQERCVAVARERFSLRGALDRYEQTYFDLLRNRRSNAGAPLGNIEAS